METNEEKLDFEMKKLDGKNQLCMEIWGRLESHLRNRTNVKITAISAKRWLAYNKIERIQISKLNQPSGTVCNHHINLRLKTSIQIMELKDLSNSFQGVSNVFNAEFPRHEYFDISAILSKYKHLKVDLALVHMPSLNTALDDIICILGAYETSIENGRYIDRLLPFDYDCIQENYRFKLKHDGSAMAISNMDFTVKYGDEQNYQSVVDFFEFFFKYYEKIPDPVTVTTVHEVNLENPVAPEPAEAMDDA